VIKKPLSTKQKVDAEEPSRRKSWREVVHHDREDCDAPESVKGWDAAQRSRCVARGGVGGR
jgi:hypothetical protein